MKRKVSDLAKVVRSKNASPFELTFDIIFKTEADYRQAKKKNRINRALMARIYGVPPSRILDAVYFGSACAVKVTMARPIASGAVGDGDVYGAQQHMPLAEALIPWENR